MSNCKGAQGANFGKSNPQNKNTPPAYSPIAPILGNFDNFSPGAFYLSLLHIHGRNNQLFVSARFNNLQVHQVVQMHRYISG